MNISICPHAIHKNADSHYGFSSTDRIIYTQRLAQCCVLCRGRNIQVSAGKYIYKGTRGGRDFEKSKNICLQVALDKKVFIEICCCFYFLLLI